MKLLNGETPLPELKLIGKDKVLDYCFETADILDDLDVDRLLGLFYRLQREPQIRTTTKLYLEIGNILAAISNIAEFFEKNKFNEEEDTSNG